jgi:hypothetical protein
MENLELETNIKNDLKLVFQELQDFFSKIFMIGFAGLNETIFGDLIEYEKRLIDLGAENLAFFINTFRKKAIKVSKIKTSENIIELTETMIKILTYQRVFERVMSKEMLLDEITDLLVNSNENQQIIA